MDDSIIIQIDHQSSNTNIQKNLKTERNIFFLFYLFKSLNSKLIDGYYLIIQ